MNERVIWILGGQPVAHPLLEPGCEGPDDLMHRKGAVRITTGDTGTRIEWTLFAPNWASLYYVGETLGEYAPPYRFRYFLAGWFEETIDTTERARVRLAEIQAKSDLHIASRTFVKQVNPEAFPRIPSLLRDTFVDGVVRPEFSVDCVFDNTFGKFCVERIGQDSTLAKMYGLSPSSFPARAGHSYDQVVSQAYRRVLKTGEPYYDHVLASMPGSDQVPMWLSYQRVILPHRFPDGRHGVSVVTHVGDVDISLL